MSVKLRNIPSVYASPVRFYEQLDLGTSYGGPLAVLVLLLALAGYAVVASGLVEREVDLSTEKLLAMIEMMGKGELTRDQLDQQLATGRNTAVFWKVMQSGAVILSGPIDAIGRIFLGAAVIYVAVALSGRKPAYHGLVAILTFAAFVEVLRQAVVVPMMINLKSTDVETSLAVLARGRPAVSGWVYAALQAVDPFVIWFYVLAAIGISRAGQLSARGAALVCTGLWLGSAGLRTGAMYLLNYAETAF